jgi:hypothetical protein
MPELVAAIKVHLPPSGRNSRLSTAVLLRNLIIVGLSYIFTKGMSNKGYDAKTDYSLLSLHHQ